MRRKSGRDLTFPRCRLSSSVSCSTMHRLVPAAARSKYCGLSTNDVFIRSPPAEPSFHSPATEWPQKANDGEPGSTCCSSSERSNEAESARAIDARISNRIAA
eukprot:2886092-Prymnesium_polylepis.2